MNFSISIFEGTLMEGAIDWCQDLGATVVLRLVFGLSKLGSIWGPLIMNFPISTLKGMLVKGAIDWHQDLGATIVPRV